MTGTETIIGIDVSKAYLDLWVRPGGRAWRCDYGEAEFVPRQLYLPVGVNQFCRFTSFAWPRCWAASVR